MIRIIYMFSICFLHLLASHILLTRKRSVVYCLLVLSLNTFIIFLLGVFVLRILQDPVHEEYAASVLGFLFLAYIYLVFKESVPKKVFTMFSVWIFSLMAHYIAYLAAEMFFGVNAGYDRDIIYMIRIGIQILLLVGLYFGMGKPYKKMIGIVPDKIINHMSLYPFAAFILLRTSSFAHGLNSIYDTILLIAFVALGYLITVEGITASSTVELQHYMANYDSLTGVANRINIMNQLAKAIEASSGNKQKSALFVCDIDGFKKINDDHGHLTGDRALVYVAQAIRKVLCNVGTIGRYGGDEFFIIQHYIKNESDVELLINGIFDELKRPMLIDSLEIQIKLSIGVSIFPDNTTDMEILIDQADSAMYEAKKREGCAFSYFKLLNNALGNIETYTIDKRIEKELSEIVSK